MRITYLHQYFNTPEMSGGTRSYEMARRLVAKGHEVNMITSWREEDERKGWFETEEAGIRVHWLPVPYSNYMSYNARVWSFLKFSFAAARRAASLAADVIFATSTPLTIALPGVHAARRRNVPMVFEVRDLWPEVPIAIGALRNPIMIAAARKLERFAYFNAAHVIALAPGMRQGVAATGYNLNNISVIPNAADMEAIGQKKIWVSPRIKQWYSETGKLIMYAGAIGEANGVDYIVQLAHAIQKACPGDSTQFVILGDGKKRREVEALATTLGVINRRVFFLGKVAKHDISEWLQICDATIMSYSGPEILYRDSVSNKFFDSIAAGRPVIANFRGFSTIVAEEYGAAIVLPQYEIECAAEKYLAWSSDNTAFQEAGHYARRLAENVFSRDVMVDRLDEVLQRVQKGELEGDPVGKEYVDLWTDLYGTSKHDGE